MVSFKGILEKIVGRDQENLSLPARANSSGDPISKKPSQKRAG
jgi:hypothetical protein